VPEKALFHQTGSRLQRGGKITPQLGKIKQAFFSYLIIITAFVSISPAEFPINTHTTDSQTDPAIAMDDDGNIVAVWSSYRQDGDSGGIFGQRFDPNCSPISSEFQINTETTGNQTNPAVAMNAAGDFIVVWHGPAATEEDREDVYAQRFDPNAQPIGTKFCVNSYTYSRQQNPKVSMNNSGAFIVVWESDLSLAEPSAWRIRGQLYDANGSPVGAELQTNYMVQCRYPDVAMDGYGDFTIVWTQEATSPGYNLIMARQYNADGTVKADPFRISVFNFSSITHPSIAMDGSGHFVVAWDGNPGSDDQDNILARRYKFDATPITDAFMVNTTTAGTQEHPDAAMDSQRRFIIVWNSEPDPDSNVRDIVGQRYDESANPLGDEFQINTYEFDDQKYPAVAMKESGEFIAIWQSYEQDGSGWGIFGDTGPKICCADFTGDGFVSFSDFCVLAEEWLKKDNPLKSDLIDDNKINQRDLAALCRQWLMPCYYCSRVDINNDSRIDFKDYSLLSADWLKQGPGLDGDITGNGTVDMKNLKALLLHWTKSCQ